MLYNVKNITSKKYDKIRKKERIIKMIPLEVRKIIVVSYENEVSVNEICRVTGVYGILKKYRETGSIEANYPGRQPKITKEQIEAIEKNSTGETEYYTA